MRISDWSSDGCSSDLQALKVSVPGLVNTSISEVKNTTPVLIIGVFDLLQTTRLSYVEAQWRPYFAKAYLFTGPILFPLSFSLSRLRMKIDRKLIYAGYSRPHMDRVTAKPERHHPPG